MIESVRFGAAFPQVVDEVVARYGVGRRFASAYLMRYEHPESLPTPDPLSSLDAFLSLPAPYPDYFEYALAANKRGETTAEWLLRYLPVGARRVLDINCGMGGLLVAFAQRGFDVFGIDTDAENVRLARANTHDIGVLNAVMRGDMHDARFVARLGTFDLITMFGGQRPDSVLRHTLSRLSDHSVLVFDAPNPDALATFEHFHNAPPLEYYIQYAEKLGCHIERIESPFYTASIPDVSVHIQRQLEEAAAKAYRAQPEQIGTAWREQIQRSEFVRRLMRDSEALHSGKLEATTFAMRYGLNRWTFLVRA